ncbi:exotoxin, partial [Staphylococcus aureus]|nr:exotoxin [Staphylococcus aureus]
MKELIVIVLLLSVSQIKDNTFQTSSEDLHHKSELSSLALNN